jgi:hypothetical protein
VAADVTTLAVIGFWTLLSRVSIELTTAAVSALPI